MIIIKLNVKDLCAFEDPSLLREKKVINFFSLKKFLFCIVKSEESTQTTKRVKIHRSLEIEQPVIIYLSAGT